MKLDVRKNFDKWYSRNCSTEFDLKEQLPAYCAADVRLLSAGLVEFQKIFFEETSFDVLFHSTTIASACMQHYCSNIMPENSIGICNELSYEKHGNSQQLPANF